MSGYLVFPGGIEKKHWRALVDLEMTLAALFSCEPIIFKDNSSSEGPILYPFQTNVLFLHTLKMSEN